MFCNAVSDKNRAKVVNGETCSDYCRATEFFGDLLWQKKHEPWLIRSFHCHRRKKRWSMLVKICRRYQITVSASATDTSVLFKQDAKLQFLNFFGRFIHCPRFHVWGCTLSVICHHHPFVTPLCFARCYWKGKERAQSACNMQKINNPTSETRRHFYLSLF